VLEVGCEPDLFSRLSPNSLTLKMPSAVLAETLSSTPVVTLFARTEAQVTVLHTLQVGNRSSCAVVYSQT
jgi:hypothetical protein